MGSALYLWAGGGFVLGDSLEDKRQYPYQWLHWQPLVDLNSCDQNIIRSLLLPLCRVRHCKKCCFRKTPSYTLDEGHGAPVSATVMVWSSHRVDLFNVVDLSTPLANLGTAQLNVQVCKFLRSNVACGSGDGVLRLWSFHR